MYFLQPINLLIYYYSFVFKKKKFLEEFFIFLDFFFQNLKKSNQNYAILEVMKDWNE